MSLSPAAELPFFNFEPEPQQSIEDLLEHATSHIATEALIFAPEDWSSAAVVITPLSVEGQDEVDSIIVGWVTNGSAVMPLPVRRTSAVCLERFALEFLSVPDVAEGIEEERSTAVMVKVARTAVSEDEISLSADSGLLQTDSVITPFFVDLGAELLGVTIDEDTNPNPEH